MRVEWNVRERKDGGGLVCNVDECLVLKII